MKAVFALVVSLCLASVGFGAPKQELPKKRIFVVSSYHREYDWSQDTNRGFCDAMLAFGYFDNQAQAAEYTAQDYVETSKVIVKKKWMDAIRKTSKPELKKAALEITRGIKAFKPDLIFLGDDEAGNYIGNQFMDSTIPMVFWGFNDSPVKYGLVETADRPGHNVTGVYQKGYYRESLLLLKAIVPTIKTFAILTDDSPSGRAHRKGIEFLARKGVFPVRLVDTVETNDYELWKRRALELQKKVDAFFVAQYSTLKDAQGNQVPNLVVARWYLENIKIPEATLGFIVKQGLLCGADDSGYKQAYEAVSIAHDIWEDVAMPATYPIRAPKRGALRANRERAAMLGITLTPAMGIEEYVDGPAH